VPGVVVTKKNQMGIGEGVVNPIATIFDDVPQQVVTKKIYWFKKLLISTHVQF